MMRNRIQRLLDGARSSPLSGEFLRYFVTSAVALAIDWALLVFCTEVVGLHYLVSAAIGFCAGLAVGYVQSVAYVFRSRRLADPRVEFALFCLIGVLGLGLSQLLLHAIVERTGINYALAKAPTAGVVFLFNFTLRRLLLFSAVARAGMPTVP